MCSIPKVKEAVTSCVEHTSEDSRALDTCGTEKAMTDSGARSTGWPRALSNACDMLHSRETSNERKEGRRCLRSVLKRLRAIMAMFEAVNHVLAVQYNGAWEVVVACAHSTDSMQDHNEHARARQGRTVSTSS
nr:hypothetical protein CFP56_37064 [Quercus suber]